MKLVVICGGRTKQNPGDDNEKELEYIENSIEKVSEALSTNGWTCYSIIPTVPNDYVSFLKTIVENKEIDEYIFYYMGHGDYNSDVDFEFQIGSLEKPVECSIVKLISETKRAFGIGKLPKRMAIIIDSCYSGKALKERPQEDSIEFLTSTNENTKSFEKKGFYPDNKEYGISLFSFLFSQGIKHISDVDKINLEHIQENINIKYKELGYKKQFSYYSPALNRPEKIIVGTSKEVNELLNYFKTYYAGNIENFKKGILTYLKIQVTLFLEIKEANDFEYLFYKFIMLDNCFYCLLKQINNNHTYLNKFKRTVNCEDLKNEVIQSRKINAIVLIITTVKKDDLSNCTVDGYFENNDGIYFHIDPLEKVNFDTDDYKNKLDNHLSNLLKIIKRREKVLELKLILDEALFKINFYKLNVKDVFGDNDNILNHFAITFKLNLRFKLYQQRRIYEKWEENVVSFNTLKNKLVLNHMCSIDCLEDISNLHMKFSLGKILKNEEKVDYIVLSSKYSLIKNENLKSLVKGGIPIATFPYMSIDKEIDIDWNKISNIKQTVFMHVLEKKDTHFIYDPYDEAKSLQTAIKNNQIKDYK